MLHLYYNNALKYGNMQDESIIIAPPFPNRFTNISAADIIMKQKYLSVFSKKGVCLCQNGSQRISAISSSALSYFWWLLCPYVPSSKDVRAEKAAADVDAAIAL